MKKIFCALFAALTVFFAAVPAFAADSQTTTQEFEGFENKVSETNVMDDLKQFKIDGKAFNSNDYTGDKPKVVFLLEDGWMNNQAKNRSKYKTQYYLYVYDPTCEIREASNTSAEDYVYASSRTGSEDSVIPVNTYRYELKFCNQSSDGKFKKFVFQDRYTDSSGVLCKSLDYFSGSATDKRTYTINILGLNGQKEVRYEPAYLYTYSGANAYCDIDGTQTTSTLSCVSSKKGVLSLDVENTFYRIQHNAQYVDLHSVWFTVPNEYKQAVTDQLTSVHGDFYEYQTQPMLVVDIAEVYNGAKAKLGAPREETIYYNNDESEGQIYFFCGTLPDTSHSGDLKYGECFFHLGQGHAQYTIPHCVSEPQRWLFWNKSRETANKVSLSDYVVPFSEVKQFALDETQKNLKDNPDAQTIGSYQKMSAHLFMPKGSPTGDFNESRSKAGYYEYTVNRSDIYNLSDSNWFYKLFHGADSGYSNVNAITEVELSDISLSNENFAKKYYVNESDVEAIKKDVTKASATDSAVYLLRFAQTDFISYEFEVKDDDAILDKACDAYVCYQTVFIDFRILDLNYTKKSGEVYSIPVSMEPLFIGADLQAPPQNIFEKTSKSLYEKLKEWFGKFFDTVTLILKIILGVVIAIPVFKVFAWIIRQINDAVQRRKIRKIEKEQKQNKSKH